MEITWEAAVVEGKEARQAGDQARWRLGDLALQVITSHGEHSLENYADAIELAYDTLKRYRTVAAAFESGTRVPNLSWTHHRVVASHSDRVELLAKAGAEGWSVRQLEVYITYARQAAQVQDPAADFTNIQKVKYAWKGADYLARLTEHRRQIEEATTGPSGTYAPIVELPSPRPIRLPTPKPLRLGASKLFPNAAREFEARKVSEAISELAHSAGLSDTDLDGLLQAMQKAESFPVEQLQKARDLLTRLLGQLQNVGSQAGGKVRRAGEW